MFITPLLFRSAAARLNISREIGLDLYSLEVDVEGCGSIGADGSIGVERYGRAGGDLVMCNFGTNIGGGQIHPLGFVVVEEQQ